MKPVDYLRLLFVRLFHSSSPSDRLKYQYLNSTLQIIQRRAKALAIRETSPRNLLFAL